MLGSLRNCSVSYLPAHLRDAPTMLQVLLHGTIFKDALSRDFLLRQLQPIDQIHFAIVFDCAKNDTAELQLLSKFEFL